uniref:NADH-ubiquinone oxidoreductase chain 6 n=1 Tax=Phyllodactylus unctus TaxID=611294 RepID=K9JWY3_9SAUR|nr:NADH dehydrogenase subunit 6 [Phyllodactylus unctus]ADY86067.1 NADH dehydrogenase subunit 6 [Phyllodactylus unctus]
MSFFVFFLALCLLGGFVGVAANPAPVFGVIGLVVGAFVGGSLLMSQGGSFVGLILLLIYLGGLLVVFAFSVALAVESYPRGWGDWSVLVYVVGYWGAILLAGGSVELEGGWGLVGVDSGGMFMDRTDFSGIALLYTLGGMFLLACGGGLFLGLFVVLELTRGGTYGALRVP